MLNSLSFFVVVLMDMSLSDLINGYEWKVKYRTLNNEFFCHSGSQLIAQANR